MTFVTGINNVLVGLVVPSNVRKSKATEHTARDLHFINDEEMQILHTSSPSATERSGTTRGLG